MTIGWHFDNTYSKLSNTFKEEVEPTPVQDPELVILNEELAKDLGLNFSNIDKKELSNLFSGNVLPKGANTIDLIYNLKDLEELPFQEVVMGEQL